MPHTAPGSFGSQSFLAWTPLKSQAKIGFPPVHGAVHRLVKNFGSVFSMKQESLPQECSSTSPKINKGLMALQSIASRSWGVKDSEKKPQNAPQSLSKSTQAVGCFYCKEVRGWVLAMATTELAAPPFAKGPRELSASRAWYRLGGKLPHRAQEARGLQLLVG